MNRSEVLNNIASKCSQEELNVLQGLLEENTKEASVPWYKNEEFIAKLAENHTIAEIEAMVKEAAREEELDKIAADYDTAGRIQARGAHDEWTKLGFYDAVQSVLEAADYIKTALTRTQPRAATRGEKLAQLKNLLAK